MIASEIYEEETSLISVKVAYIVFFFTANSFNCPRAQAEPITTGAATSLEKFAIHDSHNEPLT